MNISDIIEVKANPNIPELAPGDTVKVRQKVVEGEKTRIQVFQGVVIRIRRAGAGTNFTVRRISYGIGVERTFPIYSPMIDGVEVVRHGKVRRAKLYYLRGLSARASRIKEKRIEQIGEEVNQPEQAQEELETAAAAETKPAEEVVSAPEASSAAEATVPQGSDNAKAEEAVPAVEAEGPKAEESK
jgi:large subunit ribosomal protein L19